VVRQKHREIFFGEIKNRRTFVSTKRLNQMDDKCTESVIFRAAIKIFQKKGRAGARMQEIADEAGINKSMLHYYFRSKDKLFLEVFRSSHLEFTGGLYPILNQDEPWEDSIRNLCGYFINFMEKNPDLPMFLLNEVHQQSDEYLKLIQMDECILQSKFFRQLNEGMEKGNIRKTDLSHLYVSLIGSIVYPFMSGPMLQKTVDICKGNWSQFLQERKDFVSDMLIGYLKSA
jgi:TetR/AcrR family transcriptional regulator